MFEDLETTLVGADRSQSMYEEKWTLSKKPFENDQDLAFFFESKHHREALVRVLYAAEQKKPFALLIGEIPILVTS